MSESPTLPEKAPTDSVLVDFWTVVGIIHILVSKLGGKIEITQTEFDEHIGRPLAEYGTGHSVVFSTSVVEPPSNTLN